MSGNIIHRLISELFNPDSSSNIYVLITSIRMWEYVTEPCIDSTMGPDYCHPGYHTVKKNPKTAYTVLKNTNLTFLISAELLRFLVEKKGQFLTVKGAGREISKSAPCLGLKMMEKLAGWRGQDVFNQ
jgi:hypothetical protein